MHTRKRDTYAHQLTTAACRASKNQRSSVWLICRNRCTNGTDSGELLITRRSAVSAPKGIYLFLDLLLCEQVILNNLDRFTLERDREVIAVIDLSDLTTRNLARNL